MAPLIAHGDQMTVCEVLNRYRTIVGHASTVGWFRGLAVRLFTSG